MATKLSDSSSSAYTRKAFAPATPKQKAQAASAKAKGGLTPSGISKYNTAKKEAEKKQLENLESKKVVSSRVIYEPVPGKPGQQRAAKTVTTYASGEIKYTDIKGAQSRVYVTKDNKAIRAENVNLPEEGIKPQSRRGDNNKFYGTLPDYLAQTGSRANIATLKRSGAYIDPVGKTGKQFFEEAQEVTNKYPDYKFTTSYLKNKQVIKKQETETKSSSEERANKWQNQIKNLKNKNQSNQDVTNNEIGYTKAPPTNWFKRTLGQAETSISKTVNPMYSSFSDIRNYASNLWREVKQERTNKANEYITKLKDKGQYDRRTGIQRFAFNVVASAGKEVYVNPERVPLYFLGGGAYTKTTQAIATTSTTGKVIVGTTNVVLGTTAIVGTTAKGLGYELQLTDGKYGINYNKPTDYYASFGSAVGDIIPAAVSFGAGAKTAAVTSKLTRVTSEKVPLKGKQYYGTKSFTEKVSGDSILSKDGFMVTEKGKFPVQSYDYNIPRPTVSVASGSKGGINRFVVNVGGKQYTTSSTNYWGKVLSSRAITKPNGVTRLNILSNDYLFKSKTFKTTPEIKFTEPTKFKEKQSINVYDYRQDYNIEYGFQSSTYNKKGTNAVGNIKTAARENIFTATTNPKTRVYTSNYVYDMNTGIASPTTKSVVISKTRYVYVDYPPKPKPFTMSKDGSGIVTTSPTQSVTGQSGRVYQEFNIDYTGTTSKYKPQNNAKNILNTNDFYKSATEKWMASGNKGDFKVVDDVSRLNPVTTTTSSNLLSTSKVQKPKSFMPSLYSQKSTYLTSELTMPETVPMFGKSIDISKTNGGITLMSGSAYKSLYSMKPDTMTQQSSKTFNSLYQPTKNVTRTYTPTLSKSIEKTLNIEKSITRNVQRNVEKTLTKTEQKQEVVQQQKSLTKQIINTAQRPYSSSGLYSLTAYKPITPLTNIPGLKFGGTVKKKKKGFDVFVRRKGIWELYKSNLPRGQALLSGSTVTRSTLSASFKLSESGMETSKTDINFKPSKTVFRDYKIKGKTKEILKDTFIQRRSKRLSSGSEVRSIQQARNMRF